MRDEAIRRLEIAPGDRVLDVGCGTGFATTALARRSDEVHAIDQSPHQLARAVEKLGRRGSVRFSQADAERLPFPDNSVDIVWSSGAIEYWPRPVATLCELRRVARPDGQILVVGPDAPDGRFTGWLADAIMLFYDKAEADRLFAAAGFATAEHYTRQARLGGPRAIVTLATPT
jgi:Methylase involved in ubiquinone/menaquinone biosynthesis